MFGEKLKEAMRQRAVTTAELAERTEIAESTIFRYLKGEREPGYSNLLRIASALGVSLDYLAGQGAREQREAMTSFIVRMLAGVQAVFGVEVAAEVARGVYGTQDPKMGIPVLGKLSACGHIEFTDEGYPIHQGNYSLPRYGETDAYAFGVIAEGDAMSPAIEEGYEVICSPEAKWLNGELAVVRLKSGDMKIRKVFDRGDSILLQALKSDYAADVVRKSDVMFYHRVICIRPRRYTAREGSDSRASG